ncbi:MAG: FdhF/YdeP family oxidoreductase [Deltaproteobacteria bacterium]|nr:FdhF/YdeP family oxidoreductase [Deltaproteobacteria bacterium]
MTSRDDLPGALVSVTSSTAPASASASVPAPPAYPGPAAGPYAVFSSFRYAAKTSGLVRGLRIMLDVNQRDGFDCPGCAWPDPTGHVEAAAAHRATFEFCENGARAIAHEADARRADAAFFAAHDIATLREKTDHWLEQQGRLVHPMLKRPDSDRYEPIGWDDAFALVGNTLKSLPSPDQAVFYTSGRASNEAAFLYQLLVRAYGTNNLPDCSNMCHESSGRGLGTTLGIGKGTVQLADFERADCIFVIGQNPGTNHPRMLSTLQAARARGCAIVVINPLRERGLEHFAHPQKGAGMVGIGAPIATHWVRVKLNGDVALLKGLMKAVLDEDRAKGGVVDRAFVAAHTTGYDALVADLDATTWDDVEAESGVDRKTIEELGRLYARAERTIACWAMGITQHENGVDNVRAIVNLLLLRGNIGREGAGVCPVRGHSNVQGDRTMGIVEVPQEPFLRALDEACGIDSPRHHGHDVVHAIEAFERGEARVFVALGGNLVAAAPDTPRVEVALQKATLTVSVATKLNRTHLAGGATSLILPCLSRSERDEQAAGPQFVTVENSMGVVHRSEGRLPPASLSLKSEVAIVAGLAAATLGDLPKVRWSALVDDYARVRDLIAAVVPGFADYNRRVAAADGFLLPNGARDRTWATADGKAHFSVVSLPRRALEPGQLLLQTLRSHDQFNTTIYELNDRYRGVYGRRDVLFVGTDDLRARGLSAGDVVDVTSHFAGVQRTVRGLTVVVCEQPRGCVAGYFPELNPLVPLEQNARESHTPASKSIVVTLTAAARPSHGASP